MVYQGGSGGNNTCTGIGVAPNISTMGEETGVVVG